MPPVNWLLYKWRSVSSDRFPSAAGIVPVNAFLESTRRRSLDKPPSCAGTVPLSRMLRPIVVSLFHPSMSQFRDAARRAADSDALPIVDGRVRAPVERLRAAQRVLRRQQDGAVAHQPGVVGRVGDGRALLTGGLRRSRLLVRGEEEDPVDDQQGDRAGDCAAEEPAAEGGTRDLRRCHNRCSREAPLRGASCGEQPSRFAAVKPW